MLSRPQTVTLVVLSLIISGLAAFFFSSFSVFRFGDPESVSSSFLFSSSSSSSSPSSSSSSFSHSSSLNPLLAKPRLGDISKWDQQQIDNLRYDVKKITMASDERMIDAVNCARNVIADSVPGDFIETGVWRGGNGMMFALAAKITEAHDRRIWLFDSYEGLPAASGTDLAPGIDVRDDNTVFKMDPAGSYAFDGGIVTVLTDFMDRKLYGPNVYFIKGWFQDTVPIAPIQQIAVLRMDGDMYESTMVVLRYFYPLVSVNGYVVIDDYGHWPHCKRAVDDYFKLIGIEVELQVSDYTGRWFKKTKDKVGTIPDNYWTWTAHQ